MKNHGKIIGRLFRRNVVSMMATAVAAMLGMVIDGIIIGRFLGKDCMAAYDLIMPVLNLATAFAGVLALGSQVVCAQRLGSGNVKGARSAFSMTLFISLVLSAVLIVVFFFFRESICVMLGARGGSANLLPLASNYLAGLLPAFPCVLILLEFNSLMRLDGDPNRMIVAVSVMTVIDVTGNMLNALVFPGDKPQKMFMMGLFTSLAYFVALVIMLFHFRRKDITFKLTLKGLKLRDAGAILWTGSSSGMGSGSAMLRIAVINQILVATTISTVALAAFGIVNTIINFASGTMVGIGMTCAMIAGMILGEQDRSAAEDLVRVTLKTIIIVGVVMFAVLFGFADVIADIFKGDNSSEEAVRLAARGLRFYAVGITLYGINNAFVSYTQGLRRMVYSNVVCFLQNFVFIVTPAFLLFRLFFKGGENETDAVWISFIICEILTFITIFTIAAVRKRGIPRHIRDILFLREPFGASPEDTFEYCVTEESQIIPASQAAGEFCAEKGADGNQRYLISQFIREMGTHIARDGLSSTKKSSLDVKVLHLDDGWLILMRDNCKGFNPMEWVTSEKENKTPDSEGVRQLMSIAKNVDYINTLDLNILTVRL